MDFFCKCYVTELTLIGNKKLYFVTDFKLNFYQAEHFCRRKNMSLFTINSQTEQNNIVAYIKDNGTSLQIYYL